MAVPNTLAVDATAAVGCRATNINDIQTGLIRARDEGLPFVALGDGSNIIPAARIEQFVCLIRLHGIQVMEENAEGVLLHVAAGENWHSLVQHCVRQGWFGLENLALIPGSVGAAPVQNIGAYGVEIARFIESVEVLDAQGRLSRFSNAECDFGYRDSVFKTRPDLTISGVTLNLKKRADVVIDYPELRAELAGLAPADVTPDQVRKAVTVIRQRKLPDPEVVPNAGSFFKNPLVGQHRAHALQQQYPHLKGFAQGREVKLSAAQLIDQAGWKTQQRAGVACWPRQPLVLVNTGKASTADVLSFADAIRADVFEKFQIQLELEPSLVS